MSDAHVLSYLAGYVDGDGCFSITKERKKTGSIKYKGRFVVSSTNIEILNLFKKTFGGSVRLASNKIIGHKPQFHFFVDGYRCKPIIESLLPFLIEKREECICLIRFFQNSSEKEKARTDLNDFKNSKNLVSQEIVDCIKTTPHSLIPTEQDFSYFSGFIDAECCLGVSKYRSKNRPNALYKIYLHCNNTKFPVIKWLMERFGGSVRFLDRKSKNPKHRNQICWRLSSQSLTKILPLLRDHLRFKKPVCEELIKFSKITLHNGGARHTDSFRRMYVSNLSIREEICQTVHFLNQKGA